MQTAAEMNGFKETEIGLIPKDWDIINFEEAILNKFAKVGKIKQQEYKKIGEFPVIDQGQNMIAGYTDKKTKAYKGELPIIIFGDHTRIFKFVDFPFVCGADGVKVILPNKSKFDPRFLLFEFLNLRIPSRGYNRHYHLLKEKKILCPPLPEQRNIALILSKIQGAIEQQDKIIETTKSLKKSLMQKLFTEGIDNTEFKNSEIGQIPERWGLVKLGEISTISTGTTPSTGNKEYYEGEIPFIRTAEVTNNVICGSSTFVSKQAVHDYNLKIYPPKTVFLAMYGQGRTRGQVALLDIAATTSQNTGAIVLENDVLDPTFLWHYLQHNYFRLRATGILGHISHLNLGFVKEFMVPLPPTAEQREIAHKLDTVGKKIELEENRKNTHQQLFKTMLNKLMTGEIRVKNLDLGVS